MAVQKITTYLIVNSHGECRLNRRYPSLKWNEMAFPITVEIPEVWGVLHTKLAAHIRVVDEAEPTFNVGKGITATPEDIARHVQKRLTGN